MLHVSFRVFVYLERSRKALLSKGLVYIFHPVIEANNPFFVRVREISRLNRRAGRFSASPNLFHLDHRSRETTNQKQL